jgi:hypothetical protein
MPKEVKFTERNGEKFIAKKSSWVKKVKMIFLGITIIWFAAAIMIPLRIKDTYSEPIKRSIVVSMFFDLQQGIADQYARLMDGIKGAINLEKPINAAIARVKMAEQPVAQVQQATGQAQQATGAVGRATGLVNRVGVGTGAIDTAVAQVDRAVAQVDNTAALVNTQLARVERELVQTAQFEVNAMIDDAVRNQLDRATGGLANVILAQHNIDSIRPWRPSTWHVSDQIFKEIEESSRSTVQIIMRTVNSYFGYVAWGLVAIAWGAALFVWLMVFKKYKLIVAPFVICPNCGHAFTNKKRLGNALLRFLKPWNWI